MKKIISLILLMVCITSEVSAEQLKSTEYKRNVSLSAIDADRLISLELCADDKNLPDFGKLINLEKITVTEENPYYTSIDGVLYTKDTKTLICYPVKKSKKRFIVPEGVEYILSDAFSQNTYLTEITLPESLKKIGANPFAKCKKLAELIVPQNNMFFTSEDGVLLSKDKTVLYSCPAYISEPIIPRSVTTIAYGAFSGCSKLREIVLPDKLTKIESMAFNACSALSEIKIPSQVENINTSCFSGCVALEKISSENSDYFKTVDGILYSFDMIDLILCPPGKSGRLEIPEGVVNILNGAFDNCLKITDVIFPESLKYIARAFSGCTSLKNIELPKNQAILEYGTFSNCSSLEWIYLPNNVVIIQNGVFSECEPIIVCDEDSFAEYYAEENGFASQYKYTILYNGKEIHLSKLPFEKNNQIYIPLAETVQSVGGWTFYDRSLGSLNTYINGITVKFTMKKAEKIVYNQTEIINSADVIYDDSELYISASEFAKMFNIKVDRNNYDIILMSNAS